MTPATVPESMLSWLITNNKDLYIIIKAPTADLAVDWAKRSGYSQPIVRPAPAGTGWDKARTFSYTDPSPNSEAAKSGRFPWTPRSWQD